MKKCYIHILFIINIITTVACILSLITRYSEVLLLSTFIILFFTIYIIFGKKYIFDLNLNKKALIMSIFLCLLFSVMLPIKSCLNNLSIFNNIPIINIIIKVIFIISLSLTLLLIFLIIFSYKSVELYDTRKTKKTIMIIIIIVSLIFISSTSTGFYDYDFPNIWTREFQGWHNWHTFGFTFLIYFCRIIFNSPYLIVILNFIIYTYFCNYALEILERQTHNKKILICFLLINIFTLVGFDQLRYIKKDILFALGFCNLILTLIDYLTLNKFTKKIKINLIIFSIITVLFRHGGLYLFIFIILSIIIFVLIKRQYLHLIYIAVTILITVTSYMGLNYIGFNILHAHKYPENIIYTVPIYQVGAFANKGYKFEEKDKEYLEEYLPIEYMAKNFIKYDGDALGRGWRVPDELDRSDIFNYEGLLKINFKLFIDKPILYLRSLFELTNILWEIEPINEEKQIYFFEAKWYDWEHGEEYENYKIESRETIVNKIVSPIINIGLKKFLFNFRVRGGFPLFMLILSACLFIYKKKYQLLLPIVFVLFWYACLFLSLPLSLVRYIIPFINIYPFIFCLAIGEKNKV